MNWFIFGEQKIPAVSLPESWSGTCQIATRRVVQNGFLHSLLVSGNTRLCWLYKRIIFLIHQNPLASLQWTVCYQEFYVGALNERNRQTHLSRRRSLFWKIPCANSLDNSLRNLFFVCLLLKASHNGKEILLTRWRIAFVFTARKGNRNKDPSCCLKLVTFSNARSGR